MNDNDHRLIGPRLGLFHQQEEGPGVIFWHPRGAALLRRLEEYVLRQMRGTGFLEIRTPQLLSRTLWERSGHWEKFGAEMFAFEDGERTLALKPMSCPGHVQVFNRAIRSYRELPLRFFEFGACHRYEPSGALHGLMRTRAFTQDDAHVFCRESQIDGEVARFCALLRRLYGELGFEAISVGFSTRPEVRAGSDEVWDRAEALLAQAAQAAGLTYREQPGAGAFYGPKLEFSLTDAAGRAWQCGTIQLDFVLPERLGAEYVNESGTKARPVLIHHAILGSLERFIAILLEHHRGHLPFWLAPAQVVVAPVSSVQEPYARAVAQAMGKARIRAVVDDRSETLARRVRDAHEQGVPVFATVGEREVATQAVCLRERNGAQLIRPLPDAIAELRERARMPGYE